MVPMQQRVLTRNIHLICSGLIGLALYGDSDLALTVAQWVVFPALALSGLWIWKQGAIKRWLKTRVATRQQEGEK